MDLTRIWTSKKPAEPNEDVAAPLPPALGAALAELERFRRNRPELDTLGATMVGLLKAAFGTPGIPVPALAPDGAQTAVLERIRQGWSQGIPAVRVIPPSLESDRLLGRVRAIDAVAGGDHSPAGAFRERLRVQPDRILEWIHELLIAGEEPIRGVLEQNGLDPAYAFSIFRLTLLGELGEWSAQISSHRAELGWSRCDCPVCGAAPGLAESRGLEQQRFLRCLQCGAGWPGNRIQCPCCGKSDHRTLRYLFAEEDQNRCRLVICDACGCRLKIISTLAALTPPGLVVAEFTTLYLELIHDPEQEHEQP